MLGTLSAVRPSRGRIFVVTAMEYLMPANNQCYGCNLFTVSPSGYCDNCTRKGLGPQKPPIGAGPSSDAVILQRPFVPAVPAVAHGLRHLRTDSEIANNEHPSQRLQIGDANIRFGGRDPDIFDRIHNLCKAMILVADDLRINARSFVSGPSGETAISVLRSGEGGVDKRRNLVKLIQLIADDMKKFSQKDEETWGLIKRLRNLGADLETFLDMGGEARGLVRDLRMVSGDLETHVERRRGF